MDKVMGIIRLKKDLLDLILQYEDECNLLDIMHAFDWATSQVIDLANKNAKKKTKMALSRERDARSMADLGLEEEKNNFKKSPS